MIDPLAHASPPEAAGPGQMPSSWSMSDVLRRAYATFATRAAILLPDRTVTFADLRTRVRRAAHALADLGTGRGDRVALWLDNCPEFLEVEQAAFLAGYVRTALSPRLHTREVLHIVGDCSPRVLVTSPDRARDLLAAGVGHSCVVVSVGQTPVPGAVDYHAAVSDAPETDVEPLGATDYDLAALLYTSGTTGRPKAAMQTQASWCAMLTGLWAELPSLDERDVVLHVGEMGHLSGSVGTACYARGAATAFLDRFSPESVLRTVEELRVSVLPVVPTMLAGLVEAAEGVRYDLSSLRAVPYGGSAVAPQLLARADDAFGEVLVQLYGLSEALVPLTALGPARHSAPAAGDRPPHLASAGRPHPMVDIRIESEDGTTAREGERGEVLVRSPTVMTGYWNDPAATAAVTGPDGWFRTGDIGYLSNGDLYLVDRKKDVIVTGGYNVYPAEVERVIRTMPGVDDVVVVGAPDARWGETVVALVAPRPGQVVGEDEVIAVCRAHLASYKKPTSVHIVETLPVNSAGKVLRREIRAQFWNDRDRRIGE